MLEGVPFRFLFWILWFFVENLRNLRLRRANMSINATSTRINIVFIIWNYGQRSPMLGLILPRRLIIWKVYTISACNIFCRSIPGIFFIRFIRTISRQKQLRWYHAFRCSIIRQASLLILESINDIDLLPHKPSILLLS